MNHLIRNRKYCTNSNKLFSGQLLSSPWHNILREHRLTVMYSINIATMYWNEIITKQMIEKVICLNLFNPHIYSTGGTSTTYNFGAHELFPVIRITCCSICRFPYTILSTIDCICLVFCFCYSIDCSIYAFSLQHWQLQTFLLPIVHRNYDSINETFSIIYILI